MGLERVDPLHDVLVAEEIFQCDLRDMARSSGVRAPAAVRKEAAVLRARLATCESHEWVRAQLIMNKLVALTGHKSVSGGLVQPRSCTYCTRFGHSRASCPARKQREVEMVDAEVRAGEHVRSRLVTCREEARDQAHWEWIQHVRALRAAADTALEQGLKGCHHKSSSKSVPIDCTCAGCDEWRTFLAAHMSK